MVSLLRRLRERSPFALPLVGLLALTLVAAGVLVTWLSRSDDGASSRTADSTAGPADKGPSDPPVTEAPRTLRARPLPTRPNIVMVVADDMRTDDLRWMPSVRRLVADQGLEFRNSFSTYPLCAPARASLMTGQYAHNTGVYSHVPPYGFEALDDRQTVGTSLTAAGYHTLFLGKYLNGYGDRDSKVTGQSSFRYVPPGWTDWYGAPSRPADSGYDSGGTYDYYHVLLNHNGEIDDTHRGQYQTRVEGRIAEGLVRRYHRSPRPFFLYFAPIAPHFGTPVESDDPTDVTWPTTGERERIKTPARPPDVRGHFDREITRASGLPQDGGPSEADVRDKARPMSELPELTSQERVAVRDLTRQRAEALLVLDRQVRGLVRTLKSTGELKSTIIMFTSDNGYFLGEHRMRQGKIKPHEPSLRVPFVMSGPGVPQGERYDPVTTEDLTATVLDLAGATPPHPADGVSVVPSIARDRGWTSPLLTEGLETSAVFRDAAASPAPGFDDPRTTIGLRTPRWKYVRYVDGDGELYDLDHDPNELHSRFDDPRYARVQAQLQQLWLDRKDCDGAACSAPMATSLQRGPVQDRRRTDAQSRAVQVRYGYYR